MSAITKRLEVSGDVQGVGYRYSMRAVANREGITGWVRNRRDGSVEAILQGNESAVEAVIAWARRGPEMARVADVEVSEASGDYFEFSIRDSV